MSLRRFLLYFLSVMTCSVVAYPHWAPARHASPQAASPLDSGLSLPAGLPHQEAQRRFALTHRRAGD